MRRTAVSRKIHLYLTTPEGAKMTKKFVAFLLLAGWAFAAQAGVVGDSLQTADEWWGKTREFAGSALEQTRRLWREQRPDDAETWEALLPKLDDILGLQDRHRDLPKSSWLGEDRESNAAKINALLDEAAEILVGDSGHRRDMNEISRALDANRRAIVDLKRRKMTAPSDSMWRKTVTDIDEEIAEREAVIAQQRRELAKVRGGLAKELESMGLDIDAGGVEFLLSTVVGDEVVDMTMAFERVRDLTEQLETLTADSAEDLPTARRYYGMYTVLLRVLDRMHETLIEAVDKRYLPQIAAIGERAKALRKETRRLQSKGSSPVLAANLKAQKLTIEAAARYADYLKSQKRQVEQSRKRLGRDLAVARNTYETVKVSGDLVALMKDSRRLLESLFTLQVPRLRPFENREMQREFERLTLRLRSSEPL